ncbi:MAG TPA: hypothetical protein PLB81_05910 [Deltaproteobacteria bacterium]|nr:hypothetical protein [Deltaproteobacteria bacterium]
MKQILAGIKQRLISRLPYIRPSDIYVTGDLDSLTPSCMLPAIAIKDGKTERKALAGGMMEYTIHVTLCLWGQVFDEEASLIGSNSIKGLLEIEQDIDAALDEHLLGIEGVIAALPDASRDESRPYTDGKRDMQRMLIPYTYTQRKPRPSQGG